MPQGNKQVSTTLVTRALAACISLTEQVMFKPYSNEPGQFWALGK